MKTDFLSCPVCNKLDQEVLFPAFTTSAVDDFQDIVICKQCGCVFRNPIVPDPNYEGMNVSSWGDTPILQERFRELSAHFQKRNIGIKPGQVHLDVATGPGWLPHTLYQDKPDARVVCLEENIESAKHAKQINPKAVVMPSRLECATLPDNAFHLITACGVDFMFRNYRRELETIHRLLSPEGIFYIERSAFIPQKCYATSSVLDVEDHFPFFVNVWFQREQFTECLSTLFDVVDSVEYMIGMSDMRGLFCKKKSPTALAPQLKNWYQQNITYLQNLALETSRAELKALADKGIRTVAICGVEAEAETLARLIDETKILQLTHVVTFGDQGVSTVAGRPVVDLSAKKIDPPDAVLVASVEHQGPLQQQLRVMGWGDRTLPCFRTSICPFQTTTSAGNAIQMKAFLPATLAEQSNRVLAAAK